MAPKQFSARNAALDPREGRVGVLAEEEGTDDDGRLGHETAAADARAAGDAHLAHEAASDPIARDALARRLGPRVRRLTASLFRNRPDAEDAAQLALLEILRAAPGFRGESSLEAWADRIAVRTAIRIARERRIASVRSESAIEPDDLPASGSEDDRGSTLGDSIPRSVLLYLDDLPEVRRTVLVLRHVMGYSIEEIATQTEVSVNTVKDRLLSARDEVRKMIRRDLNVGRRR